MGHRSTTPIGVITNPRSRKNKRLPAGRAEQLRRIVGDLGQVHETGSIGEIRPCLERLIDGGAEYLVSDGGDGTIHWVLNEAMHLDRTGWVAEHLPPAVPTNGGTIDFLARKARIRGEGTGIVRSLASTVSRGGATPVVEIDSLAIEGVQRTDGEDAPFRKIGFALAAGGIGQRFFDKYYQEADPGARTIVKVVTKASASHLAGLVPLPWPERALDFGREIFRPTIARVSIDGRAHPTEKHGAIHAGAFDLELGGVFRVFPLAREEGLLHFQAGGITPLEIIRAVPDLVRGGAIQSKDMVDVSGSTMTIEATGDELLTPIIDGERYTGIVSMTVTRGPRIRVARVDGRNVS